MPMTMYVKLKRGYCRKKDGYITNKDLLNAVERVEKATKRVGTKPITFFGISVKKPTFIGIAIA